MGTPILDFVFGPASDSDDFDVKMELFARERMVPIDINIVVINADNPKRKWFSVVGFGHHTSADLKLRAFGKNGFGYSLGFAFA